MAVSRSPGVLSTTTLHWQPAPVSVDRLSFFRVEFRIHIDTIQRRSRCAKPRNSRAGLTTSRTPRPSCVSSFARLRLAEAGNLGDWKPVGNEISEMRVAFGPGYRLYFTKRQNILIVMLAGGDKSTQARDIKRAQKILQQLEFES